MGNFVAAKLCLALMTFVSQPAFVQSADVNIRIVTSLNNGRSITCSQGERLLRGIPNIRRVDCRDGSTSTGPGSA